MHIAVVNGFPCLPKTAEVEYIKRFIQAAERTGHHAYEVVTSNDIHDCRPDFVLATHEFTPKLTPFFTVGGMWSPPAFFEGDARRMRSVLSYDGYLVGSARVGQFLDDLEFSTGLRKPRSDFLFLPTALKSEFEPRPRNKPYELVYVGVHWDGLRHNGLLASLSNADLIRFYGPPASWRDYARSYRGMVPFDGQSMSRTLAYHGVALCIHKDDHRKADTPSMRLFEAAAAGCLIIADDIPFARRVLGDSAFYLDLKHSAAENTRQVREILDWANANPALAQAMAERSHRILNDDYSIETTIQRCCDFVARAKQERAEREDRSIAVAAAALPAPKMPLVDVIIRTGGRDLRFLRRAICSVAAQRHGHYRVLLVDYKGRDDIRALAAAEATPRLVIDYVTCENTGLRSTALWAGLQRVTAPFFAMLDDDDSLMPDHFPSLLAIAAEQPGHVMYYSGVVRIEEDATDFITAPNFAGPLEVEIPENRELKFLDRFDLGRLVAFDNYIQSNAWIARSTCLNERCLIDPQMVVCEDMYLYFMLARAGSFRTSAAPTAYWHWRSSSRDNSMLGVEQDTWEQESRKLIRRLHQEEFPNGLTFATMRQLVERSTAGGDPIWPLRPGKVEIGEETLLSPKVVAHTRQMNLHGPEAEGVWTASLDANLQLRLGEFVDRTRIRLRFMAAGIAGRQSQLVQISINGHLFFRGRLEPWKMVEVERALTFYPEASVLFLRVRCSETITPQKAGINDDQRPLGVFLSAITCTRLVPAATSSMLEAAP